MSQFCYSLSLDGDEQPVRSSNCDTAAAAIAHGRKMLLEAVLTEPTLAYVVVYASEELDAEPLGVWDWSREAPEPVWTAEE